MSETDIPYDEQCFFCQNAGEELSWRSLPAHGRICAPHADAVEEVDGLPPTGRAISYTDI